jgi:glycosyltransferase involved in cell wall biosynthesis
MTAGAHPNATGPAATPPVRRVLAFTGAFLPGYKAGGPIKSIVQLLADLPESVSVTLVTGDRDLGDSAAYPGLSGRVVRRGRHDVYYLNWRDPRHWLALGRWARRNPVDLIYVNSLFSPVFTVLPILAHQLGLLPSAGVLLAPRGELSDGALGIKSAKKKAFLRGWAPLLARADPRWHASTEMEQAAIHRMFPGAHTFIQPDSRGDEPRTNVTASGNRARFVFISRIAEMKNLLVTVQALRELKAEADFDIYGPVEDAGYWRQCQQLIADLPSNVTARYLGELRPDQVKDTFAGYDAFILPTRGENFGHVISESLSSGCPVICSQHTPWTQVLRQGGGAVLDELDAGTLRQGIEAWAVLTPPQRNAAKAKALTVYTRWRAQQEKTSAVERALEGLPGDSQLGSGSRAPRVAVLTQGYQGTGGVSTVARWLACGLRDVGYEVEVFDLAASRSDGFSRRLTSPASWRRQTLLLADSTDLHLTHVGANGVELEPLRYLPRADLSAALNRYDLLQVISGAPSLTLAASRCRRPIVLQVATTVAAERASQLATTGRALALWRGAMTRATSMMERRALRRADVVLVENAQMQEFVRSVGRTRPVLAPPGVDSERFVPPAEGWESTGYLLSVCRLDDARKGLDRLIRSYAQMKASRPSVPPLVLAGIGKLPAALTALIAQLGLAECVSVRPDVPSAELPSLYQGASVYLQTSHEEGLGISVIEAMASGLPVVSTATAGSLETVVSGDTGWLVSQGSQVENRVAELTISVLDDATGSMSRQARSRAVSLFSHKATLARYLEVYDQLLGGGKGRR